MDSLWQDVRYAVRMLSRTPGFTVVAVLTLALGIGANTAIFTVAFAALTRSLPYDEPERLVKVSMTKRGDFNEMEASYPNYLDWRAQTTVFDSLAGYSRRPVVLRGSERSEQVPGGMVSGNFFEMLGTPPLMGHTFSVADESKQTPPPVVLSYEIWQTRFAGDTRIVGRQVTLSDQTYVVIGVLPQHFQFAPLGDAKVFRLVETAPSPQTSRRNLHWWNVVGRLKRGVSMEQARAEMAAISDRLARAYPDSNADTGSKVVPLRDDVIGQIRPVLLVLMAAVGFVLLIASVNVANLLLARAAARETEIAIRAALGAGRVRLARQLLTESVVLGLIGGGAGVLLAFWGVELLVAGIPRAVIIFMPYLQSLSIDGRMLAFTAAVSVLTGILAGLAPVLQLSAPFRYGAMKERASASHSRLRDALVVAEFALAVMLLVGAGLLLKSLSRMLNVDPGFERQNLVTAQLILPASRYESDESLIAANREIRSRISHLPGVRGAAISNIFPLSGGGNTIRFRAQGEVVKTAGTTAEANIRSASEDYFQVLGATLLKGRYFTPQDTTNGPQVLIVNRTLAERIFPGQEAIGKRLTFTYAPDQPPREIVGVIENVNEANLDAPPRPALYTPFTQGAGNFFALATRTGDIAPAGIAEAIRREVRSFDPNIVVLEISSMQQRIANSPALFLRRYPAVLTGVFAGVALLLAMVGIYGVISYLVTQRTREIGVRMALGAKPRQLLGHVMGKGARLAAIGTALGLAGAVAVSRLIANLLFGVRPGDGAIFTAAMAMVTVVALAATYLPARRASKVDPMVALRYE